MNRDAFAELFYQQCTGSTAGHMAMIPNNPVLYSMIVAAGGKPDNTNATNRLKFAKILRQIAEELENDDG